MPLNSKDFPLFSFNTVYEATKHFSNETKLGEGGFGPVSKVVMITDLIVETIS